jgi:crossover junction endodeoxyribonuclease RuvC
MKIIAIDPGYDRVGIAIIEKTTNQQEIVVFSTCIITDRKKELYERFEQIRVIIAETIAVYRPELLVMEELYFARNTTTALRVAESRGIISSEALRAGIPVHEIHPNHVKIAITGQGNATKDAILWMLPKLVTIDTNGKLDDELDAIAIGVAYLAQVKLNTLLGGK